MKKIFLFSLIILTLGVAFVPFVEAENDKLPLFGNTNEAGEAVAGYDDALVGNRITQSIESGDNAFRNTIRGIFVETVCKSESGAEAQCEDVGARVVDVKPTDFIVTFNIIIGAIGILMLVFLGVRIIFSDGDEEKLTSARKTFGLIVVGLILVSLAQYIAFAVLDPLYGDPLNAETGQVQSTVYEKVKVAIRAIELFVGLIFLIGLTISGYRLIISQGEEERVNSEKQFVKNFILGLIMILFAESLIRLYAGMGGYGVGSGSAGDTVARIGIIEIVGFINFLLTFAGIAAFVMMILAIFYLLISLGDEDRVGRAKNIIINCLIGIFICVSAYAIVRFLIPSCDKSPTASYCQQANTSVTSHIKLLKSS